MKNKCSFLFVRPFHAISPTCFHCLPPNFLLLSSHSPFPSVTCSCYLLRRCMEKRKSKDMANRRSLEQRLFRNKYSEIITFEPAAPPIWSHRWLGKGRGALKRRFPTNYKVFSENPPKWNCLSSMHFTASYLLFQIHPSISVPFITCAFLILFSIKLTDVSSHVLVNTRWCKLAYLTVWKQTNVIQHLEILVPSYQGSSTGGLRQYCKGSANYFLQKNVLKNIALR